MSDANAPSAAASEQAAASANARAAAGQRVLDMIRGSMTPEKLRAHLRTAPAHVIDYMNDSHCTPLFACCWHARPDLRCSHLGRPRPRDGSPRTAPKSAGIPPC